MKYFIVFVVLMTVLFLSVRPSESAPDPLPSKREISNCESIVSVGKCDSSFVCEVQTTRARTLKIRAPAISEVINCD